MPQRINIVGDLGTTKIASDSYDADNVYLTEEGWVYRHFKSTDGSRYWDEILVAGEVPSGDSPEATNPPKLGTVAAPTYEVGDGEFDINYSEHQVTGTPGTYTTKVTTTGGGVPEAFLTDGGDGEDGGDGGDTTPPAVTLGTVTITGSDTVASEATGEYTASSDGDAVDGVVVISADGGATVDGNNVTFPAGPASVTVTATVTSETATDSPATATLVVTVEAAPVSNVTLELTGAEAGNTAYQTDQGNNAALAVTVGQTLVITNNSGAHPVDIVVADQGAQVSEGTLTGAPAGDGSSVTWDTTGVTPGTYYYQCTSHPAMIGTITVST